MGRTLRTGWLLLGMLLLAVPGLAADLDSYYLERFAPPKGGDAAFASAILAVPGTVVPERCGTPLRHGLRRDWPKLAGATQAVLAKQLARPALSGSVLTYPSGPGHFRVHYTTTGVDAPPLADGNGNGTPDWVETVAAEFEAAYQRETGCAAGSLCYTVAPTSSGQPYDVYLKDLAARSEFGYTESDLPLAPGATSYTSFIVIDNDFLDPIYGTSPGGFTSRQALQSTAAHEYHHAIQYGYNFYFDIWYAEATSTWSEDEVFDDVDQLYNYVPAYFLNSALALNIPPNVTTGGGYGRWIFNRSLAERHGQDIVRQMWERLATIAPVNGADIPMLPVLESVLLGRGSSLGNEFVEFSKLVYTRAWTTHTNDIPLIHSAVPIASYVTYPVNATSQAAPSITLFPYSFAYYTFLPTATAPQDLTLTITRGGDATAIAFKKSTGGVITAYPLNAANGTIVVPGFAGSGTDEVALLLSNGTAADVMVQFSSDGSVPFPPTTNIGGSSGGGCFIATAAYGSYLHPKVAILRQFRDSSLLTNRPGRMLVELYYRCSPSLAAVIARHPVLRGVTCAALAPVVWGVEHPSAMLLLGGGSFLAMGGSLGWYFLKRRREV